MITKTAYFIFKLMAVVGTVWLLTMIVGCKVTESRCQKLYPPPPADTSVSTSVIIRETLHDTTVRIKADQATFEALLKCGDDKRVMIEELNHSLGLNAHYQWTLDNLSDGTTHATLKCYCDSQSIYVALKSFDTTSREVKIVTKNYRVLVLIDLTWWQRFKIDWGDIAFGILALAVAGGLLYTGARIYGKFMI